ncbi:MAG: cytochrome b/b6 domain-containing protein [Methyloligellaceae bacterium]
MQDTQVRTADADATVRVWDPFVRAFHWTLVVAFFAAYVTDDDVLAVHVWAGYAVGGLVLLRVVWGFIGPRHARFSDFVFAPMTVWRYAIDLLQLRAERHLGHSPVGGAMVVALLVGLAATVWSGLETHAVENSAGPLAMPNQALRSASPAGPLIVTSARADDRHRDDDRRENDEGDEGDDVWEELHEVLADLVFVLVILHIGGVALASIVHRENLVRSMITGDKRAL